MLKRIIIGVFLTALFLSMVYFGGIYQYSIFTVATIISVYEMKKMFKAKGTDIFALPLYLFAASYYWIYKYLGGFYLALMGILCITFTIAESIFNKKRTTYDRIASIFTYCYPMLFYVFLMLIGMIGDKNYSGFALLSCFAIPLIGDTFAYFIGVLFGKHKLCPHISPKKTVEGAVGGLIGGIVGGIACYFVKEYIYGLQNISISIIHFCIIGFLGGLMGEIGDLWASCLKRWSGIKDYGNIFPGHGGIMDRVDSVLVCAPLVYMCFYGVMNNII